MGYEMYRLLSMKKSFVMGKKRKSKKPAGPIIIDLDEEDRQQELMKGQQQPLVKGHSGLSNLVKLSVCHKKFNANKFII